MYVSYWQTIGTTDSLGSPPALFQSIGATKRPIWRTSTNIKTRQNRFLHLKSFKHLFFAPTSGPKWLQVKAKKALCSQSCGAFSKSIFIATALEGIGTQHLFSGTQQCQPLPQPASNFWSSKSFEGRAKAWRPTHTRSVVSSFRTKLVTTSCHHSPAKPLSSPTAKAAADTTNPGRTPKATHTQTMPKKMRQRMGTKKERLPNNCGT